MDISSWGFQGAYYKGYVQLAQKYFNCSINWILTCQISIVVNTDLWKAWPQSGLITGNLGKPPLCILFVFKILSLHCYQRAYYCKNISHWVSSVSQSCPTLCDPMNRSRPGLPVHHKLLEFTQTRVHWVGDAIQASHPLLSPFPPALNLPQHQSLFKWVRSLHQVAKILEFQHQHQSLQWTPRTDLL